MLGIERRRRMMTTKGQRSSASIPRIWSALMAASLPTIWCWLVLLIVLLSSSHPHWWTEMLFYKGMVLQFFLHLEYHAVDINKLKKSSPTKTWDVFHTCEKQGGGSNTCVKIYVDNFLLYPGYNWCPVNSSQIFWAKLTPAWYFCQQIWVNKIWLFFFLVEKGLCQQLWV